MLLQMQIAEVVQLSRRELDDIIKLLLMKLIGLQVANTGVATVASVKSLVQRLNDELVIVLNLTTNTAHSSTEWVLT